MSVHSELFGAFWCGIHFHFLQRSRFTASISTDSVIARNSLIFDVRGSFEVHNFLSHCCKLSNLKPIGPKINGTSEKDGKVQYAIILTCADPHVLEVYDTFIWTDDGD